MYENTLPMSTYILAFIVSEFEGLDPIIEADSELHNRVRFQFWARPSSLKQTEWELMITWLNIDWFKYL